MCVCVCVCVCVCAWVCECVCVHVYYPPSANWRIRTVDSFSTLTSAGEAMYSFALHTTYILCGQGVVAAHDLAPDIFFFLLYCLRSLYVICHNICVFMRLCLCVCLFVCFVCLCISKVCSVLCHMNMKVSMHAISKHIWAPH